MEKQGQDISSNAKDDLFGKSVSISKDWKSIAEGTPQYWNIVDDYSVPCDGQVEVYKLKKRGTEWVKMGDQIKADVNNYTKGDAFGESVSLSNDE